MNRRTYLKTVALAGAAGALPAAAPASTAVQLHVDLDVDPAKEKDLLVTFRTHFRPAITKQPGFVDVKLLKLVSAMVGSAPPNTSYRLLIIFQTEEQRKAWVATPTHQQVWPMMEANLKGSKFSAVLFQVV
jgi:heme-degrading monooxygenase HmoA